MLRTSAIFIILTVVCILVNAQTNKVLLIGIDGCRPDALQVANTPNLDALVANGTSSFDAMNDGITVSGPGWSSLLTGVWPAKHGITNNGFGGSNLSTYPHLFQRIEEHDPDLHTVSICQWHPINNFIAVGSVDTMINVADHTSFVEVAAVDYLTNADPDAIFLHFDDVDHAGHGSGFSPSNPIYISAIETVDQSIGEIINAMNDRPDFNNENWVVIVSTDHGGINNSHGGNSFEERNIFLVVSGDDIPIAEISADSNLTAIPPAVNCLNDSVQLFFDGNSKVNTILDPNFNFGTIRDFTVECRVRTSNSGDVAIVTDKDWDSGFNKGWVFSFNVNGGPWKVNVGDGSDRLDLEGGIIDDNEWHTLSATFDRDGMLTIYEDGSQVGSGSMAAIDDIYSGFPISMGQDPENDYSFVGHIAEVRVFLGLVSPLDIDGWKCTPLNNTHPNFSGLVGFWRLTEGGNSFTAIDGSPTGANGTITGAQWENASDTLFNWQYDFSNTPKQVDFNISALEHLCVPIDPSWDLDGQVLGTYCGASLALKMFLEGPFDTITSLMNDDLRAQGLIPTLEPFTALGFIHVGGSEGGTLDPALLSTTGNNAIVDWVFVELRDQDDNSLVVATQVGLVQRDGDVISTSGEAQLQFPLASGDYFVAVRHRNHLGTMIMSSVNISTPTVVDFTEPSTFTYGSDAQFNSNGITMLWAGNSVADNILKYTGADNDRDPILVTIGGAVPTAIVNGYYTEDVNMDGVVKYTGLENDRDPILSAIGGVSSTAIREEQLP